MGISRSTRSRARTCLLVWRDLWPYCKYCFEGSHVGSQDADISLEKAATTPSPDSGRTVELKLQLDAATPAPICMVRGKGILLKPPCTVCVLGI